MDTHTNTKLHSISQTTLDVLCETQLHYSKMESCKF